MTLSCLRCLRLLKWPVAEVDGLRLMQGKNGW